MPVYKFSDQSTQKGNHLETAGPVIPVMISLPVKMQGFLSAKGIDVPPPIRGTALIDTGASTTAVDVGVFKRLGTIAINKVPVVTPHGRNTFDVYPATISFPTLGMENLSMESVVGVDLEWAGERDTDLLMLLGRDLLKRFLMVYSGMHSDVTLGF